MHHSQHARFLHGLRGDCVTKDGASVAQRVALLKPKKVAGWLRLHLGWVWALWDAMEDEAAEASRAGSTGANVSDTNKGLDAPIDRAYNTGNTTE